MRATSRAADGAAERHGVAEAPFHEHSILGSVALEPKGEDVGCDHVELLEELGEKDEDGEPDGEAERVAVDAGPELLT